MDTNHSGLLLGGAIVTTGLAAGTLFGFAVGVMPGLAHTSDRTAVETMQAINVHIVNPIFLSVFMGAAALSAAAALAHWRDGRHETARWIAIGAGCYLVTLLITAGANIPLNDELARAHSDFAAARERFQTPWMVWNALRTVTATAALACLGRAAYAAWGFSRTKATPWPEPTHTPSAP